jgi:Fe-S-cluster-containing dehydrogenase component
MTNKEIDRRNFLITGVISLTGLSCLPLLKTIEASAKPILMNAKGVLLADPSRCTGCGRCELACTEFNFGKAHPLVARIKIRRNLNYGPNGPWYGQWMNLGKADQGRIIQETCKQCAHPVPCALSCPEDAILPHPETGARYVDTKICSGCGVCVKACPWEMPTIDPDTGKAVKCDLCGGTPECVDACPTGALRFVNWRDLTNESPMRRTGAIVNCKDCHQ